MVNEMEREPLLNMISALADLGYSTTHTRKYRWNILKNRAVSEVGLDRTTYIIKHLINYNGKSERRKLAIEELKYDFKRLNDL